MSSDLEYSLGLNLNPFRDATGKAVTAAGELGGQIAKKFEMRDIGRTLATALGLNLENMAENVARFLTGVSKEEEEALKRLGDLSDQVTAKQAESNRAKLNDEQRYQLLLQDQERLVARIAENQGRTTADQIRLGEDKLKLIEAEKQSTELLAKMQADYDKDRLEQQRARENEAKLIDNYKREREEFDRRKAEEANREYEAAAKERAGFVKDNLELMTLEAKLLSGRINPEERDRLEILRLQAKAAANTAEIQQLMFKGLANLTPPEKTRLNTLINQNEIIGEQIGLIGKTTEKVKENTKEVESNIDKWKDLKLAIQNVGRGDSALSDAELQKKVRNLNNDIATRSAAQLGAGGPFTGSAPYDPLLDAQRSYLTQTQAEIDLRAQVRRNAAFFGEAAAFQMFGGSEQRFNDILRGISEQQAVNRTTATSLQTLTNLFTSGRATVLAIPPRG